MAGCEPALVLQGGWILDDRGRVGDSRDVAVADGVIQAVGVGLVSRWPDAAVVDCRGMTVMAGLVDAHVHLTLAGESSPPESLPGLLGRAMDNAEALLRAGVTTVRDVGGNPDVVSRVSSTLLLEGRAGSDITFAGQMICPPGGHGTEAPMWMGLAAEVDGEQQLREAIRHQASLGAQWVKLALNKADGVVAWTSDFVAVAVTEAHSLGLRLACHASVPEAIRVAVEGGADTIEHGNGLDNALAADMRRRVMTLVPTTCIFRELAERVTAGTGLEGLPSEFVEGMRTASSQRISDHEVTLRSARDNGVSIALGTDRVQGAAAVAVVEELTELQRHGLSRGECLRAATLGGARALGLLRRGAIRKGWRADLLAVAGRVDEDLALLRHPHTVVAGGALVR